IDLNMSPGTYSPTGYDLDCMIMGEGFFMVGDKDTGESINSAQDLATFTLSRMGDFWVDANGFVCDRRGKCLYGFEMVQNPEYDPQTNPDVDQYIPSTKLVPLRVPVKAQDPKTDDNWQAGDPVYDILTFADPTNGNARSNAKLSDIVAKAAERVKAGLADGSITPDDTTGLYAYRITEDDKVGVPGETYVEFEIRNGAISSINDIYLPQGYGRVNEWSSHTPQDANAAQYSPEGVDGNFVSYKRTLKGVLPNWENSPIKLTGMAIGKDGAITGTSENGQAVTIGYVTIVNAAANDGVTHIDGYYYKALEGAGDLSLSVPGGSFTDDTIYLNNKFVAEAPAGGEDREDGLSTMAAPFNDRIQGSGDTELRNGGLEASTADVANEFAQMILTQRGYQANTRMVTVTDSMLEELINMKR
ncbi:MAG: hypothetical protein K2O18_12030, partial [Oscillospiraceae bacterium]|nr:hypothetical protein [Oscillospiraceae bacterium]